MAVVPIWSASFAGNQQTVTMYVDDVALILDHIACTNTHPSSTLTVPIVGPTAPLHRTFTVPPNAVSTISLTSYAIAVTRVTGTVKGRSVTGYTLPSNWSMYASFKAG